MPFSPPVLFSCLAAFITGLMAIAFYREARSDSDICVLVGAGRGTTCEITRWNYLAVYWTLLIGGALASGIPIALALVRWLAAAPWVNPEASFVAPAFFVIGLWGCVLFFATADRPLWNKRIYRIKRANRTELTVTVGGGIEDTTKVFYLMPDELGVLIIGKHDIRVDVHLFRWPEEGTPEWNAGNFGIDPPGAELLQRRIDTSPWNRDKWDGIARRYGAI